MLSTMDVVSILSYRMQIKFLVSIGEVQSFWSYTTELIYHSL